MPQRRHITSTITGLCILLTPGLAHGQTIPNRFPILGDAASAAPTAPTNNQPAMSSAAAPLNQRMADAIAARLQDSGQLRHYSINIEFQNGVAQLNGRVGSEAQRALALSIARTVPGVELVREHLQVEGRQTLTPVQAFDPLQLPEAGPAPQPMQIPRGPEMAPGIPGAGPVAGGVPPVLGGSYQEPEPIFRAGFPDASIQPPLMPPYAWPTYAPYNNYSRVAYPTLYPYEAFPFIGPCYPFPKIPLGWRSVSLTWQDGYWWYGKNATGHDWWRIRYW